VPRITAAADAAERPAPRVVVGLPVAVCSDPDAGRERAQKLFAAYLNIPTYQRILARGGDDTSPADVAVIGTEAEVTQRLRSYAAAGATDLCATALGLDDDRDASQRRTIELLASLTPDLQEVEHA
jgi:alkanesulfonate monooxygenase SsuD/methylene tetrahydromethanopterin reductase-like flavin-dependent oxidoreductase (luciferase family)